MESLKIPIPEAGIPEYPSTVPLLHGKEDDATHRLKRGISNKLRDLLQSSPFGVNILHIRGEYGSGKTKTVYRIMFEIYHPDEAADPDSIIAASGIDTIELIKKNKILVVYLTFEKAYLGKYTEPNVVSILRSALDEIREPTESSNKEERSAIPIELIEYLDEVPIETLSLEDTLQILRKYFDRVIIIVDELERILELTRPEQKGIMESMRDDFINRYGTSDYGTYLVLLYEPRVGFIIPPALLGRGREFATERFSSIMAKKVLHRYLKGTDYMRFFLDAAIHSIFELSHRCGRQFLVICRDALVHALGKGKSRVDYEDILLALEGVRGPGGEELYSRAYYSEITSRIRQVKEEYVEIFKLMLGEYFPHLADEIAERLKIDQDVVLSFIDKFDSDVPDLPISPLITKVYLVNQKEVEEAAKRCGVAFDILISDVLSRLTKHKGLWIIPNNISDFDVDVINKDELHKELLKKDEEGGYMFSLRAFKHMVGLPIPTEILDLIKDGVLRRQVEEYFSEARSSMYGLQKQIAKGLDQILTIEG